MSVRDTSQLIGAAITQQIDAEVVALEPPVVTVDIVEEQHRARLGRERRRVQNQHVDRLLQWHSHGARAVHRRLNLLARPVPVGVLEHLGRERQRVGDGRPVGHLPAEQPFLERLANVVSHVLDERAEHAALDRRHARRGPACSRDRRSAAYRHR